MCSIYLSIFLFAVSLRIQEDTLWQICLISNVVFSNGHLHLKLSKVHAVITILHVNMAHSSNLHEFI